MGHRAWLAIVLLSLAMPAAASERDHAIATVRTDDRAGAVVIRYRDGITGAVPKAADQKSLSRPALAADGHTVGWLGDYDTCCQSYPVARQLIVWRAARVVRRIDAEAMIWNWRFYDAGQRVGFADGPTHGSVLPYGYKLYDVATGRLIAEIDGHAQNPPDWVKMLMPGEDRQEQRR